MPTPTNRYFNTSGWGFTPAGGSSTPIDGVTSADYDEGISVKKEGADFDGFPTLRVRDWAEPMINIETLNAFVLYATLAGASGTLVGTIRDAYNGAVTGGGAKLITMSQAAVEKRGISAKYREFARQNLSFGGISVDGATHPVAVSAV